MNREQAYRLLAGELAAYSGMSVEELASLVGQSFEHRATGADTAEYLIEIAVRRAVDGISICGTIDNAEPQRFERLEEKITIPLSPATAGKPSDS